MNQRRVGAALLLIAALVLVMTKLAGGTTVAGLGARAPLPAPPAIGSCLSGPDYVVVDCDQPHGLEVVANWTAEERFITDARMEVCANAAQGYVGEPALSSTDWYISGPQYDVRYLSAPREERAQVLGWRACAIVARLGSVIVGSAKGVTSNPTPPSAFGACADGNLQVEVGANISCAVPHQVEILATQTGFVPDDPSQAAYGRPLPPQQELESQCWQIASDLLATADPSYGDRLVIAIRISTMPGISGLSIIPESGDSTTDSKGGVITITGSTTSVSCLAKAAGAGILAQSLIGNSDKPLPIQ